jgi:hypothetical protein
MFILKKLSLFALLLSAVTACAPGIRMGPNRADIYAGSAGGVMISQTCAAGGTAFVFSGGAIADSMVFGRDPQQIRFHRAFLSGAQTVNLLVRLWSDNDLVAEYSEVLDVDTPYTWRITRLPGGNSRSSRYSAQDGVCRSEIDAGQPSQSVYGVSIGNRSSRPHGRPAW